jgi:hypothetical protein
MSELIPSRADALREREFYRGSAVGDACAGVAPFSFVEGSNAHSYLRGYDQADVTLVLFTVVDDQPNSLEQTLKTTACAYLRHRRE